MSWSCVTKKTFILSLFYQRRQTRGPQALLLNLPLPLVHLSLSNRQHHLVHSPVVDSLPPLASPEPRPPLPSDLSKEHFPSLPLSLSPSLPLLPSSEEEKVGEGREKERHVHGGFFSKNPKDTGTKKLQKQRPTAFPCIQRRSERF